MGTENTTTATTVIMIMDILCSLLFPVHANLISVGNVNPCWIDVISFICKSSLLALASRLSWADSMHVTVWKFQIKIRLKDLMWCHVTICNGGSPVIHLQHHKGWPMLCAISWRPLWIRTWSRGLQGTAVASCTHLWSLNRCSFLAD